MATLSMTQTGVQALNATARPVTAAAVALRPSDAYRRILRGRGRSRTVDVFGRAAFTGILSATAIAVAATGRVSVALVLGIAVSWALIPLVQVCAGALLIVTARRRAVPLLEALDLFLMGHVPWSLWLLGAAAAIVFSPAPFPADRLLAASALVPLAWTAVITAAFGRTVLQSTPRAAALRAAVHQLALWGGTSFFFIWLTDSWARVLALFSA